ncbi:MAG: hypothetical protein QM817_08230 [Archangium sp.]
MSKSLISLFAVALVSSGCSVAIRKPMLQTERPRFEAHPQAARVIFVRPSRAFGAAIGTHITDGSRAQMGDAVSGTTFAVDVAPGRHQFCVGNFASSGPIVEADLQPGSTYMLRVDIAGGYPYLTPIVDRRDAEKLVKGARGTEFGGVEDPKAMGQGDLNLVFGRCSERSARLNERDRSKFVLEQGDAL